MLYNLKSSMNIYSMPSHVENHSKMNLIPSASAAVDLSSDAGPEVCSGTTVTFTCRVSAAVARWRYNGSAPVTVADGEGATPLGPFTVTVIDAESDSTFVTTTATAPITSELSGTNITCEDLPLTEVDSATLPDITGQVCYLSDTNSCCRQGMVVAKDGCQVSRCVHIC